MPLHYLCVKAFVFLMKLIFKIVFILSLYFNTETHAQNVILNPSFELYANCPPYPTNISDQISICDNWNAVCVTADYFNVCSSADVSIPDNWWGYQSARTGNAYLGFWAYVGGGNGREYVGSTLSTTLQSNVSYCVQYYLSLTDSSKYAVDKIGAYFSDTIVHPFIPLNFSYYIPQIESAMMLNDTIGWTKIAGIFTAQGGGKIITIGNLRDDASTNVQFMHDSPSYPGSYYYLDDVSVEEVLHANAGRDTLIANIDSVQLGNNPTENATYLWQPTNGVSNVNAANPMASPDTTTTYVVTKTQCSVITTDTVTIHIIGDGVNEYGNEAFKIYPNPASTSITVEFKNENINNYKIELRNILGQLQKLCTESKNNITSINIASLPLGVYFIKAISKTSNHVSVIKFVKN